MPVTLDVVRQFDPAIWQTVPRLCGTGSSLLLTWTVTPSPIDAGIPNDAARVFAEALCSIGPVIYGGDPDIKDSRWTKDVTIRRGLQRTNLALFCANSAAEVLPAFSAAAHDWSMNAQWLVVAEKPKVLASIVEVTKELYQDWKLPDPWPSDVMMIVQAGVDGDGAACHSASRSVEEKFVNALGRSARAEGFELRIDLPG